MSKVSSGVNFLDRLLGGGYDKDIVTTIYGPSSSGKTNLCILTAIQMARSGKKVIIIDSEGGIAVERIKQIAGNYEEILEKILFLNPLNFEEQKEIFERFIKEKAQGAEFMEYQSGLIPIYNSQTKIQKGNIFLLGDAASQVKATTYGGIIPHLISAQKLKEAIKENKNYEELLIPVKKELDLSLKLRKIMNKFTENDYNSLIEILSKKSAKNILETFDRDHPSKFIFKLALAQPKLLKFGLKLL